MAHQISKAINTGEPCFVNISRPSLRDSGILRPSDELIFRLSDVIFNIENI